MEATQHTYESLVTELGGLLDAGDGAVVTLESGDTRLAAHRAVLSARSPVFAAMFAHDTREASTGSVHIPDVEGPVLRQLLAYLYTLQVPQLPGMAPQLLVAADKYGVLALKDACEQQVAAQLSVETAVAAIVLALRHCCSSLKEAAIAYIKSHGLEVMTTQGWYDAIRKHHKEMYELCQLLSETSASLPAISGTNPLPAVQPPSDQNQTSASAAPGPAASRRTRRPNHAAISCLRASLPAISGTNPLPAVQPPSDQNQTSASAAPGPAASRRTRRPNHAAISCLRASLPAISGTNPLPAVQPPSDQNQTSASAAPGPAASRRTRRPNHAAISCLRASLPATSGTSPPPVVQLPSDHSQTLATSAAPAPAASRRTRRPNHAAISCLRSLPAEEKGRMLIEAAKQGAVGELEMLLAAGADVGAVDKDRRRTGLHWAADRGHEEAARRLLAAGAAVDARDERLQSTPLHDAAYKGHAAVVRLLLAAGADHTARNVDEEATPLHYAACNDHIEAATALLEGGADRGARDEMGATPLDVARECNYQQMVDLLQGW